MTFESSWDEAERYVFDDLCRWHNSQANATAFRGYLPSIAGAWMISSGGSIVGSDQDRMAANGQSYASLNLNMELAAFHAERVSSLMWASRTMQRFKDTNNYKQVHNVSWCHPVTMPQAPVLVEVEDGVYMWQAVIQCQLIFRTDATY